MSSTTNASCHMVVGEQTDVDFDVYTRRSGEMNVSATWSCPICQTDGGTEQAPEIPEDLEESLRLFQDEVLDSSDLRDFEASHQDCGR